MASYSELVAAAKAKRLNASLANGTLEPMQPGGANELTVGGGDDLDEDDQPDNYSGNIAPVELGVDAETDKPGPARHQMPTKEKVNGDVVMLDTPKPTAKFVKTAGISHGIVFGWGIVCKDENGNDYIDFQGDHIPEDAMLDATVDFAKGDRPGKDMHSGPDVGQHVFLFPLTGEIAKALGIQTKKTGLLLGYKPPDDMLAKFMDGTYTGFSIGGERIKDVEVN